MYSERASRSLTRSIMRRVYLVWILRQVRNPFLIEGALLVVLSVSFAAYVSVVSVVANFGAASSSFSNVLQFITRAFTGTELATKTLFSLLTVTTLIFAATVLRRRSPLSYSRFL